MIDRAILLWRRFAPLEERLLGEVRKVLPLAAHESFDAQVAAIARVQRSPPSWSEICFYPAKKGGAGWTNVPSFPCTDEFPLAEVRFKSGGLKFKSTLSSIQGYLFDFHTTPGPRRVAFSPWDAEPTARLLGDPLRAPTGMRTLEPLPSVWEKVLEQRLRDPQGHWRIHDQSTAYRVALEDAEYLVLAERSGDEFILHRLTPRSEGLFHLSGHDGTPVVLVGDVGALIGRGA